MKPGRQQSIASRLFVTMMLFSIAATAGATFIQTFIDYRAARQTIESDYRWIQQTYLPSLSASLWHMDTSQLQLHLNGLLYDPHISYLAIQVDGRDLVQAGTPATGHFIERTLPLTYPHNGREVSIGRLLYHNDLDALFRPVWNRAGMQFLLQGGVVFCIAGLLFVLVRRRVTSPLAALAAELTALDPTGAPTPLALRRRKAEGKDELDQVVDSLNTLSAGLRQAFAALNRELEQRQKAERELQQAHDQLDARVQERTLELQKVHAQLLHAEKLSAIGKLAASIAHEFNNPLFGVMNVLTGLRKRAQLSTSEISLVSLALQECHRMSDLIQDLRDFNRPTSGVYAPMDLHAAIDGVLVLAKKEFQERRITILTDFDPNLPQIRAVGDQIKQVLLNLLNNAADACEGGGTITVATERRGTEVRIAISDSGCGIAPEAIPHIFEPFFTTKQAVKGTGLGLAVSHGIVQNHQGRIEVESQPNRGATFTVILPIHGALHAKQENPSG